MWIIIIVPFAVVLILAVGVRFLPHEPMSDEEMRAEDEWWWRIK